ncbi:MAG TPA: heme exporter protein CcmD [Burkholderiales bacterium]|jgi:heme exporter protein CcmD
MSHGFFLWGAYTVTFVALALEMIFLFRRSRRAGPPRRIK